jgi:signal transduction histidine kinase
MDPDRAMSQYVRDRWGTERGFPGGTVLAISQTADGYLWVGTDRSLLRFDGSTFREFMDSARASKPAGQVSGLVVDAQGNLWARLRGARVVRYQDGEFEGVPSLETGEDAVTAMTLGNDGVLLLAGIVKGALRWGAGRFETVAPGVLLPARSPVISMVQAPDGSIWMGTHGEGLFYLRDGRVVAVTQKLPGRRINALLPVGARDVWVGTDTGVARWNGSAVSTEGLDPALRTVAATAMIADRESNVWIGTDRGLLRVNARGVSRFEREAGVPVTALFEDREGSLWIGTPGGLERLRDSSFINYGAAEGMPSGGSGPVHVDAEGRTWFAPSTGGLFWLRGGRVGRVTADGLRDSVVYSIAGRKQAVWVGRRGGGLTRLSFEGDSLRTRSYRNAEGLGSASVYAVHESRDGTVWAGAIGGGVSRFSEGRFTAYGVRDGIASDTVTSIADGADGTTWFATPNGLSALAGGRWRTYTTGEGLPSNDVNCVFEDSAGVVWIGTSDGLAFVSGERAQVPAGLPTSLRDQVFGLAEDRQGWLWIATARQVLRARLGDLKESRRGGLEVTEFGPFDGLPATEIVKRHRSVVSDLFGRIWFSTTRGLSVVDPLRAMSSAAPLIARLEAVSVDGAPLNMRAAGRIPPGPRRVTFAFSGVSLSAPDRIRFRYRLDGFDHGWSEPIPAREAIYTNLGPGSYRFRVMATNSEGLWNGPEAVASLDIAPRVWQMASVRVAAGFAAAAIVFGLYRLRLRRLTRQITVRFEERLAERTRIAQDLHDTLLQGFLSASMQLHVAVDQIPADSREKARLGGVLELMARVIDEGRNAVRGLRAAESGSADLEESFSRVRQELGIQDETLFRVIGEGPPRALNPMIRDDVYRIGREALVNAFRHSAGSRIEVAVERARDVFRVRVRDDGRGIDSEILRAGRDGHWGLSGMRERAQRIGGTLRVWSRPGAGTEVELSIPGHVAFHPAHSQGALEWLRSLSRPWSKRIPRSGDSPARRVR